ncbi:hypothetical protein CK203_020520 [Vitis vinifera]|uniref:Uncharacterized protein n=1 Tax=Vitis vinifera TaxID=29760 RepID=A0A438FN34_VITVI|nr:hypothetical protein CK203_020520 [Vitis vinifera]
MASCSNPPPLSSPFSPSLQTRKLFAPLSYPRSGGPSYALHFHAKRGIRFSNPPLRLKVLCSADYDKVKVCLVAERTMQRDETEYLSFGVSVNDAEEIQTH